MLELLTLALFLLVAAGTAWTALRSGVWRARAVHRLTPIAPAAAALPSPALLWRELVSRIGGARSLAGARA